MAPIARALVSISVCVSAAPLGACGPAFCAMPTVATALVADRSAGAASWGSGALTAGSMTGGGTSSSNSSSSWEAGRSTVAAALSAEGVNGEAYSRSVIAASRRLLETTADVLQRRSGSHMHGTGTTASGAGTSYAAPAAVSAGGARRRGQ